MKKLFILLLAVPMLAQASVVNVSPGDDVQRSINFSAAGDTINFAPGTYDLRWTLNVPGNRTYNGNGALFKWTGGNDFQAKLVGNGATVTGLTFDGSGIAIAASNATITHCTFQNCRTSGMFPSSAVYYADVHDINVNHCTFQSWTGENGILGYNPVNSHFDDNTFERVSEGMHFNGTATHSTILRNTFNHTARFALEIQTRVNDLDIGFNWADNFTPANHATMAYSLAMGEIDPAPGDVPAHVHNNYAGGAGLVPLAADGGQSYGFEIMGWATQVYNNLVNGPFVLAIAYGYTTPAWSYHDNVWAGLDKRFGGVPVGAESWTGSGPTNLPPDPKNVYNNQDLPKALPAPTPQQVTSGNYWGVNSGAAPPAATQPATQQALVPEAPVPAAPVPAAPTTQPDLTGRPIGGGQVRCTLAAPLIAAAAVQIRTTRGRDAWQTLGTLPAGTSSFTVGRINANYEILVQVGATDPANVQNTMDGPDPAGTFTPTLLPPPTLPVNPPSLTHTIRVFSDGSLQSN